MNKYIFVCFVLTVAFIAPLFFAENHLVFYGVAVFIASLFTSWRFVRDRKVKPSTWEITKYSLCASFGAFMIFLIISNTGEILMFGFETYEAVHHRLWGLLSRGYIMGHIFILMFFYYLIKFGFRFGMNIFNKRFHRSNLEMR